MTLILHQGSLLRQEASEPSTLLLGLPCSRLAKYRRATLQSQIQNFLLMDILSYLKIAFLSPGQENYYENSSSLSLEISALLDFDSSGQNRYCGNPDIVKNLSSSVRSRNKSLSWAVLVGQTIEIRQLKYR